MFRRSRDKRRCRGPLVRSSSQNSLESPPLRYVTSWRMNIAAALFRASSATIPQIAERVGYNTEVGFSRAFKRFLGAAPAAYRRSVSSTIRTKT